MLFVTTVALDYFDLSLYTPQVSIHPIQRFSGCLSNTSWPMRRVVKAARALCTSTESRLWKEGIRRKAPQALSP